MHLVNINGLTVTNRGNSVEDRWERHEWPFMTPRRYERHKGEHWKCSKWLNEKRLYKPPHKRKVHTYIIQKPEHSLISFTQQSLISNCGIEGSLTSITLVFRSKPLILLLQVVFDLPNLLRQGIQLTILGIITHHQCIGGKVTRPHCNSGIVSASSSPTSLLNAKSMVSVDC